MKKILRTLGLVLMVASASGPALADGGHHGWQGQRYGGGHGYRSGGNWVAPLIALGVAGAVWSAAAQPTVTYTAPPVTYYPPQPVQPAAGSAYYCGSAGQYYPNTPYCPEGWQLVQPGYR